MQKRAAPASRRIRPSSLRPLSPPRPRGAGRGAAAAATVLFAVLALAACGETASYRVEGVATAEPLEPAAFAEAESLFDLHCAACHGPAAAGTDQGPPLVHRVYEPRHHSDFAFMLAIRQGVRAHHWRYGDMPPVPGIDDDEARLVIAYIRQLQRDAGIY